MLNAPAAALLAVLAAAAATREPVTGAFGLTFDEPLTDSVLAASLEESPYPLPPRNLDQTLPAPVPGAPSGWYLFVPQAVPALLEAPGVRFFVLRGPNGYPVRILAEHPTPDCAADVLWLTRSVARLYGARDDPFGAEREGFRQSARFTSELGQIDISCGPRLLIEYTNPAAYDAWLAGRAAERAEYEARQARLADERARLERERLRRIADLFTNGDRYRLEGAFGIEFGEPIDAGWLGQEPVTDQAMPITIPGLPDVVDDGRFTVTVGPDLKPIRITGEFPDPDARRFDELARVLKAKYGTALKDGHIHKIHKISGDYLVARYIVDRAVVRLVFIDDEGREGQRQRALDAQQARLAEQQRQFEEDTAGL